MDSITAENNKLNAQAISVDPEAEVMIKSGIHLGHARSKNHPSMQPYIFGVRNGISLIDLTKTREMLEKALRFIREIAAKEGVIFLVGTRPAARRIILEVAEKTKMPYLVERWIGGALTNFKTISKRVEYMEDLERAKTAGEFEKYTKKERMEKEKEIVRLEKLFNGLRTLKRLPDLLFIVDIIHDNTAVREAKRLKIPTVALVDTNSDFDSITWPIPSNDDALPAIRYMVGKVGEAIEEGRREGQMKKEGQQTTNGHPS